jgi:dimeric dUTPase (all-alpha-NTP-PPase superfamily)
MGKEVFTKNIDLTKNLVINTSNLENGYYSIQLLQGNRTVTHSFLKTN